MLALEEIENTEVISFLDMEDPVSGTGLESEMTGVVESETPSLHPSEIDLENTATVAVIPGKFIHVLVTEIEKCYILFLPYIIVIHVLLQMFGKSILKKMTMFQTK